MNQSEQPQPQKALPKRIILLRHGESEGNLDTSAYTTIPDHKIPLTAIGLHQARLAGRHLRRVVSSRSDLKSTTLPDCKCPTCSNDRDNGSSINGRQDESTSSRNNDGVSEDSFADCNEWKVYFYVSPYERTRATLKEIGRAFSAKRVIGAREECRIREQDFGNFQVAERMKAIKETRERFGRFFYRFPEGESAADVYDRVSSFLESLWRDIDMNRLHRDPGHDLNLIIVTHGLTSRVFLMKWFKWTVEQFEYLNNLGNCEFRVMQLGEGGEYSLAIHHTEEEMREWGLSPDMIADQKWRAHSHKGGWSEKCPWLLHIKGICVGASSSTQNMSNRSLHYE